MKTEYELQGIAKREREKQNLLDKTGMFKKEYAPQKESWQYSKEEMELFPCVESVDGQIYRYRKIYKDLTDDEFEQLKRAVELMPTANKTTSKDNIIGYQSGIAKLLLTLAVVMYIAFFVLGIVMGYQSIANYINYYLSSSSPEFNFGTALVFWIIGLFSGSMMLGFANIVDNLNKHTKLLNEILHSNK